MPKFFIQRPIFAIVISLMMVILGLLSAFNLPVAQYPQISPPTVNVTTNYVGANASVVNETVAQIIEEQVNGTQGMDYMSANADDSGRYSLSVQFELGTDGDMDAVKVQNNVAIAQASLPNEVQSYGVTTKKASNDMALIGSLYSPNSTYSREFLKNYASIYLIDQIKRVPGVGDVNVYGPDYAMRVWLNPDRLAELGLTVSDVTTQYTGKVSGRLTTPEEFGNVVVRAGESGAFVRLKDIARIETGARSNTVESKANGQVGIAFGVQLTSDANAMQTVSAVRKIIQEAEPNFPPDMKYVEIVDSTEYIRASLEEVVHTFVEALLLVMLIVFLFLQSWRATLIPMLAVPVSLIATFGAFIVLGFTINTLTLFAMVLAIGLVVDDAIVVIENVERNMTERHLSPKEATEIAMDEVQGPVVAIAFVLAAVFVPVAFLGGMMAISMALSAFIALTLTPALCALLLKPHQEDEGKGFLDRFFDRFNDWFERTTKRYVGGVSWFIKHARTAAIVLLTIVVLTVILYRLVPSTFVPAEDQGYYIVSVSLPEGTSLNRTSESMSRLAAALQENPGVKIVMNITGIDILSNGSKSNAGVSAGAGSRRRL